MIRLVCSLVAAAALSLAAGLPAAAADGGGPAPHRPQGDSWDSIKRLPPMVDIWEIVRGRPARAGAAPRRR